jgi:hypothetical protein
MNGLHIVLLAENKIIRQYRTTMEQRRAQAVQVSTKSHSLQLVLVGSANNIIQVPAYGKFHASLNALWYRNNNSTDSLIQLRSPQMRLKYPSGSTYSSTGVLTSALSSATYPCFTTTAAHQIGGLNGSIEWDVDLQGQIEVQMVCVSGDVIDTSDYCIANITLTPLTVDGSQ